MAKKNWAELLLTLLRWDYTGFPDVDKAVVLMAPHTSTIDFMYGRVFFAAFRRKPAVLIKKESFYWPVGPILKKMGGVPVNRGDKKSGVANMVIDAFNEGKINYLVITPEGTRKKTKNWKKGFIKISKEANVPVLLGFLDTVNRRMGISGILDMSGTDEEIMERMKRSYLGLQGLKKDNFITGYE